MSTLTQHRSFEFINWCICQSQTIRESGGSGHWCNPATYQGFPSFKSTNSRGWFPVPLGTYHWSAIVQSWLRPILNLLSKSFRKLLQLFIFYLLVGLTQLLTSDVESLRKYATSSLTLHRKTSLACYYFGCTGKRNRTFRSGNLSCTGSMGEAERYYKKWTSMVPRRYVSKSSSYCFGITLC